MSELAWQPNLDRHEMHLGADSTHVWLLPCKQPDAVLQSLCPVLDEAERCRAERYRFERDRSRFVASRAALRQLLAAYLDCAPAEVAFDLGAHGKPRLAGRHETPLRFNLSTSGDWGLLAVTAGREVGVDVERINRERADPGIVSHYFAAAEVSDLEHLHGDAWVQGFFNCWTRKEALIKATGEGLSRPLDSFEVSLQPGQPAALIRFEGCRQAAERWRMAELADLPGYASAVVVAGSIGRIHCFTWEPS